MTAKPAAAPPQGAARLAETGAVTQKPLFNRSEQEMFGQLEACVAELSSDYRVFGQVALAEVVATASRYEKGSAYHAVKERRLDFVVSDRAFLPLVAAEFHGPWHKYLAPLVGWIMIHHRMSRLTTTVPGDASVR